MWTNLIENAVEAMDGKGVLRLSTRAEADEVVVDVSDAGRGCHRGAARKVEAFFTTKAPGQGTGLRPGHTPRRRPAPRHTIIIDSRPRAGRVLQCRIPRAARHLVDAGRTGTMLAAVTGTGDHVRRNRAAWDRWAAEYAGPGVRNWAAAEPAWGIWNIAEAQAGVLPADLEGRDSIELGCGTGYVSAWLARRGARPVGLDNSAAQLATARQLQDRFGLRFPLIHASAEQAPFADARFDLAISEYGASIWCDPYRWIPEAARLLRPGGQLIFLVNSVLLMLPSRTPTTSLPPSGCCGPTSACTGSSGPTMSRWSSASATAT